MKTGHLMETITTKWPVFTRMSAIPDLGLHEFLFRSQMIQIRREMVVSGILPLNGPLPMN